MNPNTMEIITVEMRTRMYVIQSTIHLEDLASKIMSEAWHLPQEAKTRTLGNTSSSLSFRAKMDILQDFGSLDKKEYKDLIKLMEIRNQFAHNANCRSWLDLMEINSEIKNHLKDYHIQDGNFTEKSCQESYDKLYKKCLSKLNDLEETYHYGNIEIAVDYAKHLALKQLPDSFDDALIKLKPVIDAFVDQLPPDFFECLKKEITEQSRERFLSEFEKLLTAEERNKIFKRGTENKVVLSFDVQIIGSEFETKVIDANQKD